MAALTQASMLFIFSVATLYWRPNWMKGPAAPPAIRAGLNAPTTSLAYQEVSYARYAITVFVVLTLVIWLLSGFKGLAKALKSGRWLWVLSLGGLVAWVWFSAGWSVENEAVATSQAWQWVLTFAFVVMVLAVGPRARWVSVALVAGMLLQASIGTAQVLLQRDIGISWIDESVLQIGLGLFEFPLDPAVSGISVIQTAEVRFLRAHGITPHPNLLAPGLVLAIVGGLWMWQQLDRRVVSIVITIGLWGLFLTFSRASVGGLVVGTVATSLAWLLAGRLPFNVLLAFGVTVLLVAGVFYMLYHPLINVRVGVGTEGETSLETLSVTERAIYEDHARQMIREHTLRGVGIGNFPWVSHRLLRETPEYEIRGNNVHHVYYLAAAEVGVVGAVLVALNAVVFGGWVFRFRQELSLAALAVLGGIVAWLAIGFFEFFFWSLLPYQILFWGALAVILKDLDYADHINDSTEPVADATNRHP